MSRKDETVIVRMTLEEKDMLKKIAEVNKKSISSLLRDWIEQVYKSMNPETQTGGQIQ